MESCAGYKYSVVHVLYPRERDIEMDGRVKSRSLSLFFFFNRLDAQVVSCPILRHPIGHLPHLLSRDCLC